MGGFRSFFIESKFFQLVVEEGGNFFSLRIFERGKYFMQSVFMGKNATRWLMQSLEHTVIGVNPKHFFMLREGDTAYTVQRGSNSFGQYLLVIELKVGGMRRSIIIPVGKAQQGWRAFGIELRRMLEPSHYALGGPKALSYKSKLGSEIHPSRSFAETVKASVQVRKHLHQPPIKEMEKIQVVESTMPPPRDEAGIQVVAFEILVDKTIPIAVGGVEGSHRGNNGDTKNKEKIPEQNKFRLNNLNLKDVDFGRERQIRRSSWLGKGLIVEVNEFGKRWVSWQHCRGNNAKHDG